MLRLLPASVAASFFAMLFCVAAVGFFGSGIPWLDVYFPGSGRYHDQALKYLPFSRVFLPSMLLLSAIIGKVLVASRSIKAYGLAVACGGALGGLMSCFAALALLSETSGAGLPGVSWFKAAVIGGVLSGGWLFGLFYFPLQLWLLRSWNRVLVFVEGNEKAD
jgi:hypothetical protein